MVSQGRPTGSAAVPSRESGSGSLLVAFAVLVAGVVAALVVTVMAVLAGWQRVRGAADLVALSAATAHADGGEACRVAAAVAAANNVVLRRCSVAGDLLDFVVTVEVGAPQGAPLLPDGLATTSHAGALTTVE